MVRKWRVVLLGLSVCKAVFAAESAACPSWGDPAPFPLTGLIRGVMGMSRGHYEVLGECLYVRPQLCDLGYVVLDDRPSDIVPNFEVSDFLPSGKLRGVSPRRTLAFRVALSRLFNCDYADITGAYTQLKTSDVNVTAPVGLGGIWVGFGNPRFTRRRLNNGPSFTDVPGNINALAREQVRTEYHMADVTAGSRNRLGCDLWYRAFVGVRWAEIRVRRDTFYQGTTVELIPPDMPFAFAEIHRMTARTEVWGVGPRLGLTLSYDLLCGIGLDVQLGASLLVGESQWSLRQRDMVTTLETVGPPDIDELLDTRLTNRHYLIPECDCRLGVSYFSHCGCHFGLLFQIGWEFVSYVNALGRVRFNHDGGTDREVCDSYNLNGLYASILFSL